MLRKAFMVVGLLLVAGLMVAQDNAPAETAKEPAPTPEAAPEGDIEEAPMGLPADKVDAFPFLTEGEGEEGALPPIPDEELFIGKISKDGDKFTFQEEEGGSWAVEVNEFVKDIEKKCLQKPLEIFGKIEDVDGEKILVITSYEEIEEEEAFFLEDFDFPEEGKEEKADAKADDKTEAAPETATEEETDS